jgi:hypothetical protein
MHNRIFLHARVVCSTELGVASRARTFQPSDLRLAHSIRLGRVPRTECVSRSVLSACAYNDAKDALSHRRTASVISPTSPRDEVAAMCEASKVAEENRCIGQLAARRPIPFFVPSLSSSTRRPAPKLRKHPPRAWCSCTPVTVRCPLHNTRITLRLLNERKHSRNTKCPRSTLDSDPAWLRTSPKS